MALKEDVRGAVEAVTSHRALLPGTVPRSEVCVHSRLLVVSVDTVSSVIICVDTG